MHAALQSFLRLLRSFLSFGLTAAFGDLLLRSTLLFLFVLLLPLFVLQDQVLPVLLVLGRALLPVAGIFLTRLLPALAAFLAALFPPVLLFLLLLLLLLAKAEPFSDSGTASGIRCWRRCERNSPADPQARGEGGEEVLRAPEQRFPCRSWGGPW